VKLEALDHPKTLDLAARLEVELPTAIGHLELLWAFTGKKAPQGNIGKWPDGAIARACYWMGRPEVFLLALQESGFIDADDQHRFTVHDWQEHCPRWVKSKLATLKLEFAADTSGYTPDDTSGDTSPDSKGREDKPRQGKKSGADAPPPIDGLNLEAWNRWLDYRRKLRKPLKPVSMPEAMAEMVTFGEDQAAVVKQSIAKGWQGLFPLKSLNGATPQTSEADNHWPKVREAIKEGRWPPDYSPDIRVARVISEMGGLQTLGMRNADKIEFTRREFRDAYQRVSS
jgi:hypothetical protein